MFLQTSPLRKILVSGIVLAAVSVGIVSCGSSNTTSSSSSSSSKHKPSGLKFRAFVSNALFPSGATDVPVINIVNALLDTLSTSSISLLATLSQPQLMALSPDLSKTIVFSPVGTAVAVIDNTAEAIATGPTGTTSIPAIFLPGLTESMFVANDNQTAYAAIPGASVNGQSPGAVVQFSISTGAIEATIPVPAAHYIVPSPDGNHILVFSDNSDSITDIATILIGSNEDPRTTVNGFDRPVWAIFNGGNALIFNCGPECGGTAAGIATFTVGGSGPTSITPVVAATYGIINGNLLYVAGTPPNTPCGSGTAAPTCGKLSILNLNSLTVTGSPITVTDGFHNRMAMGANGQLFVGARTCTSINVLGGEVRGCLAIYNTNNGAVVVPPQIGDATGIQPISGRNVVYFCEGGFFQIFDTMTDKLLVQPTMIDIVGQCYDVKQVDPPQSN